MSRHGLLVLDVVRRVFPYGTNGHQKNQSNVDVDALIRDVPNWPPDLFGVCAFLLERSSLYQFFVPGQNSIRVRTDENSKRLELDFRNKKTEGLKVSGEWIRSTSKVPPKKLIEMWKEFIDSSAGATVSSLKYRDMNPPDWAKNAFILMLIADEVCQDMGQVIPGSEVSDAIGQFAAAYAKTQAQLATAYATTQAQLAHNNQIQNNDTSNIHVQVRNHLNFINMYASTDMFCVQPKVLTAQIGATMRTLSKNIALLPPLSRMRTSWDIIPRGLMQYNHDIKSVDTKDGVKLNLLLIPFPFKMDRDMIDYYPESNSEDSSGSPQDKSDGTWGWFKITQHWLGGPENVANIINFVSNLIEEAELKLSEELIVEDSKDSDEYNLKTEFLQKQKYIHGIVFPEYSLDWNTHVNIFDKISERFKYIEFMISGSSTNCEGDQGNFVLNSFRYEVGAITNAIHHTSRAKHHRWRIEERQIETYGLTTKPEEIKIWWEDIELPARQIHNVVFRPGSAFTTLVCEDLARSDPCHESIRATGANLIICLLMDNAQLPIRWPARYAAALSDDPGSSVLTFTSRAFVELANEGLEKSPRAGQEITWDVAMWRDPYKGIIKLSCPPIDQAIVLKLNAKQITQWTYDGRQKEDVISWVYEAHKSIGLYKNPQSSGI